MMELLSEVTIQQVKYLLIILFCLLILWVWRRPGKYIKSGAPDSAWWRDLRLWASAVLILQIGIYFYF